MNAHRLWGLALVLALLVTSSRAMGTFASTVQQKTGSSDATWGTAVTAGSSAIVIDHTCTDLSKVPTYWINRAKEQLRLSYGHTSHGSQVVTGMSVLRANLAYNHLYDYNTNGAITPGVLSLADGTPSGDLGSPDRVMWEARTRTYLNTPGNNRNVVVWSWCGQAGTATEVDINTYLNLMSGLEADYPGVAFVYMTGHLDGSGEVGNLNLRNNQIRAYCVANDKVLFDFADIESYDPDGSYFLDRGADDGCYYDSGNWAQEWCAAHPGDPRCETCSCAHSEPLNCNLKARAFWWMLARLAGWDGPPAGAPRKTAAPGTAIHGQTITYTVVVQRFGAPLTATVALTDVVPTGLSYVPGTLAATAGVTNDADAPTLRWSGVLTPTPAVTVTYAVTVDTAAPQAITNTAFVAAPGYSPITTTAAVWVNPYQLFLPLAMK